MPRPGHDIGLIRRDVGGVRVELARGDRLGADVASRRYVTRLVVVLPLLTPFRRTLLVTADMLDPQEFRLLRIWALWNRLPTVAPKQLTV